MTTPHLIDQLDAIDWDEQALNLFLTLTNLTAADQCGAIVLVSAAVLLAREFPEHSPDDRLRLAGLGREFAELVLEVQSRLVAGRMQPARPVLRVVGGRDA
jgi:hypothetical protein